MYIMSLYPIEVEDLSIATFLTLLCCAFLFLPLSLSFSEKETAKNPSTCM